MRAPTAIRLGLIAIGLLTIGFTSTVGFATILFTSHADIFIPKSSSDIAAWIQAVGSIGAIVGAFLIMGRQINATRMLAQERHWQEKTEREEAQLAVITLLRNFGEAFKNCREQQDMFDLQTQWNTVLKNNVPAALAAFDALPLYELGSSARILNVARIRSAVQSMYDITSNYVDELLCEGDSQSETDYRKISDAIATHSDELDDAWTKITFEWPPSPQ